MANSGPDWLLQFLYDKGLRGETLKRMFAIGMRESGGRPTVDNAGTNRDGSIDYGLFQINGKAHGARIKQKFGWTMEDLRDPDKNFEVMKWMSKNGQDLSAWGVANPDGSVTGWAAHIGNAKRQQFERAMQSKYPLFDKLVKKTGLDVNAAAQAQGAGTAGGTDLNDIENGSLNGAPAVDTLNKKDLAASYGIAANVLKGNKELGDVLDKIITGKITDPSRQLAMLQNTNWFKQHTSDWLAVEKSRLSKDPALWDALINKKADEIVKQFTAAGAPIDRAVALKYAKQLTYGSSGVKKGGTFEIYDDKWLSDQIVGAIDFHKTKTVNGIQMPDLMGKAQQFAQTLYGAAQDYGMETSMSKGAFASWFDRSIRGLMGGTMAVEDVTKELQSHALSLYPGLAPQLQRGMTLRQAADPYLKVVSDALELDQGSLDLHDDLMQRVLNSTDEAGQLKPISLYDAKLLARKDSRWQYTSKAKEEYTGIANTILQDFGFLG